MAEQPPPQSDRERLAAGLHQTETTESRVNEAFLEWLTTAAPWWLAVILLVLCAYLFVNWYGTHQFQKRVNAWSAYTEAQQTSLPRAFEDVATQYAGIDAIEHLARLRAGDLLLEAVQTGEPLSGASTENDNQNQSSGTLSDEQRQQYLDRAEGLYQQIIDADDGSLGMALHAFNAYNGLAAVGEARGAFDQARAHYQTAAERVEEHYPTLAARARQRIENLDALTNVPPLPSQSQLPTTAPATQENLNDASINPALNDLLLDETDEQ